MKKNHKLHKIITALVVALAIVLVLPTASVDAAGAKLNKKSVTVCTGKSYTLKMSGISKKVKWSTSNKSVVSISKKSGKKSEKCTIKGNKKGTATITAKVKVGEKTKTFRCKVTVKRHTYDEVTYTWNKDMSKCSASKECKRCHRILKQTVKTTKKTTRKATCSKNGIRQYTAKFTKYDFGTKTKKVTTEKLDHVYKEPTYSWSGNYSSCTAKATCKQCGGGISEKGIVTSVVTKPATKTSIGVKTYTAKFKTKGFTTQTKTTSIPKIAYLDKASVIICKGKPATVTLYNDTITWVGCAGGIGHAGGGISGLTVDKPYDKYPVDHRIEYEYNDNTITISTNDMIGAAWCDLTIQTARGQTLMCHIDTEFIPGTTYVGKFEIGHNYSRDEAPYYYCAYGDLKGTWTDKAYQYLVKCQTREEYDAAEYYYTNQTLSDGRIGDLSAKVNDIDSQCYVRRDWNGNGIVSDFDAWIDADMESKGYDFPLGLEAYFAAYPAIGDMCNLYDQLGNFRDNITSQAQVDAIVTAWANEYNGGELPSWYYPTVFSDWAEWSGHDYVE